jgi:hypothetical protein
MGSCDGFNLEVSRLVDTGIGTGRGQIGTFRFAFFNTFRNEL